jgi:tRNA pseudouridine38-40 synthase
VYCEPQRSPLIERFAWRVWPPIELDRLQEAARLFLGKHDFSAFGTPPRPGGTTVRTIMRSEWKLHNGSFLYEVCADAFLYHMVRRMVFLQVRVGKGHLPLENLEMAIHSSREESPGLAPAKGLVLTEVCY